MKIDISRAEQVDAVGDEVIANDDNAGYSAYSDPTGAPVGDPCQTGFAGNPSGQAYQQQGGYAQASGYNQPYQAQTPNSQVQYAPVQPQIPSPFTMGWQDIKCTPNAVSGFSFKALVACIPFLNFCLYGMGGKWGRQPVDGNATLMPKKVVDSDNFTAGFFYFLISLVLGCALVVVNIIPFVGQIVSFAAAFFVGTFAYLMYYRYLAYGSFSEAWNFKDIWDKAKRNFGSLWVATFVPSLICGSIGAFVGCLLLGIFGVVTGTSLLGAISGGSGYALGAIMGMLALFGVGSIICMYLVMIASTVGFLWSARACGYWVARYAPEWSSAIAQADRAAKESAKAAAAQAAAYQQQQQQWAQAQQQDPYAQYAQQGQYDAHYAYQPVQPQQPIDAVNGAYSAPNQADDGVSSRP